MSRDFCVKAGIEVYWGIGVAALFFIGAGGMTLLAHQVAPSLTSIAKRNRRFFLLLEAALVVLLLVVGLTLRLLGMEDAEQVSVYYDAAKVIEGQEIPWMPHAAAYIYVRMLHGAFVLLGNRYAAGIWIQVILQLAALSALHFVLRRFSGTIGALVIFGYCVSAPYMVGKALVLSPEMLYFFFFAGIVVLMAAGCARGLKPGVFGLTGILTALCCYLDIMGILLILLTFMLLIRHREEGAGVRRKISAAWRYMAGVLLGGFACAFLEASLSGTVVWQVMRTWLLLYEPKGFSRFAVAEVQNLGLEAFVLFALMSFGIFSFWCDRQKDNITACMLTLCVLVLAGCYGVFTEEIPGFFYIYLLFVLQAGMGVGQAFHVAHQEEKEERYGWEALIEKMEENESLREAMEQEMESEGDNQVQYIENPLPLPKKHVKRALDYSLQQTAERDDFDYPVSEEDDFDI